MLVLAKDRQILDAFQNFIWAHFLFRKKGGRKPLANEAVPKPACALEQAQFPLVAVLCPQVSVSLNLACYSLCGVDDKIK
jgi:hypothetical protein